MKIIKVFIFILLSIFIFAACSTQVSSLFNELINESLSLDQNDHLKTYNTFGKNCHKKYFKILKKGKKANFFLLNEAKYKKKTAWWFAPMGYHLNSGDIAICLLLNINAIEFDRIIPEEIMTDYQNNGSKVWWMWLNENDKHRATVIREIKQMLDYE